MVSFVALVQHFAMLQTILGGGTPVRVPVGVDTDLRIEALKPRASSSLSATFVQRAELVSDVLRVDGSGGRASESFDRALPYQVEQQVTVRVIDQTTRLGARGGVQRKVTSAHERTLAGFPGDESERAGNRWVSPFEGRTLRLAPGAETPTLADGGDEVHGTRALLEAAGMDLSLPELRTALGETEDGRRLGAEALAWVPDVRALGAENTAALDGSPLRGAPTLMSSEVWDSMTWKCGLTRRAEAPAGMRRLRVPLSGSCDSDRVHEGADYPLDLGINTRCDARRSIQMEATGTLDVVLNADSGAVVSVALDLDYTASVALDPLAKAGPARAFHHRLKWRGAASVALDLQRSVAARKDGQRS